MSQCTFDGSSYFSPTSSRILLNQTTSHVALDMALYSTFVDDKEIVGRFLLLHDTTLDPMLNAKAQVDLLSSRFPAQPESEKPTN